MIEPLILGESAADPLKPPLPLKDLRAKCDTTVRQNSTSMYIEGSKLSARELCP